MKNFFHYIAIVLVLVGLTAPLQYAFAEPAPTPAPSVGQAAAQAASNALWSAIPGYSAYAGANQLLGLFSTSVVGVGKGAFESLVSYLAYFLMKIAAMLVAIGGFILNYVINVTIVNMAKNVSGITGINVAWKIIRDLMNIGFIFMLIYQGIKLIISQDNIESIQQFIFGIVLASLLINFSLFFTKIIIDSSNIVTIGIYNTIVGDSELDKTGKSTGLSNAMMQSMGIQSIWGQPLVMGAADGLEDDYSHTVSNLLATVLFLVTAFTFLAVSALLVVRYIVLIFLLTLSPIGYMGMGLPKIKEWSKQWWDTLMGQIIFAPLFMLMMLITLTLIAGNLTGSGNAVDVGAVVEPTADSAGMDRLINIIFNFTIIIGFTIGSLITAKKYAGQGNQYVGKMSSWASGKATEYGGRLALGGAARLGTNTIGAVASRAAQSQRFQNAAANNWLAEKALRATRKTADASFDVRATAAGGALASTMGGLGTANRGGFNQTLASKISDQNSFAQSLRSDVARGDYARRIAGGPLTIQGSRSSANTVFGTMGRGNRVVASGILNTQLGEATTARDSNRTRIDQLNDQNTRLMNEQSTLNAMNGGHGPAAGTPQDARLAIINGPVTTRGSLLFVQNELTTANSMVADLDRDVTDLTNEFNTFGLNNPNDIVLTPVQRRQNAAAAAAGRPLPHAGRARRADEQNF